MQNKALIKLQKDTQFYRESLQTQGLNFLKEQEKTSQMKKQPEK